MPLLKFDPTPTVSGGEAIQCAAPACATIFVDFFGSSGLKLAKSPSKMCETECNLIHTIRRRGNCRRKEMEGERDSIPERSPNKRV